MTVPNASNSNHQIVHLLTNAVRVLSEAQVSKLIGDANPKQVTRRLHRLQDQGLIQIHTAWLSLPVLPTSPLCRWEPSAVTPNFTTLAQHGRQRWSTAHQPTKLIVATDKARNLRGAIPIREPRESEMAHDLWVAELHLNQFAQHPLYLWLHEDGFDETFPEGNRPDAALIHRKDSADIIALELLGRYRADKIEQFHHYCHQHGIRYEIW